jgi:hypothetical protein
MEDVSNVRWDELFRNNTTQPSRTLTEPVASCETSMGTR